MSNKKNYFKVFILFLDYDTYETVTCNSHFIYDAERQRSLQHFIQIEDIPEKYRSVRLPSGIYSYISME